MRRHRHVVYSSHRCVVYILQMLAMFVGLVHMSHRRAVYTSHVHVKFGIAGESHNNTVVRVTSSIEASLKMRHAGITT